MRTENVDMARTVRAGVGSLVRRPWTHAERSVVVHGLFGRLLLAIEPLICFLVFGGLTASLIFFHLPGGSKMTRWESAIVIAPIFGLAALAFLAYTIGLLVAPARALVQTFSPIYIVDGYVRYRKPDHHTQANSNGYVAVLDEQRCTVAEWASHGVVPLPDTLRPALMEFSFYGGIHRIDGRSTGAVPESIAAAGVGIARAPRA